MRVPWLSCRLAAAPLLDARGQSVDLTTTNVASTLHALRPLRLENAQEGKTV